MGCAMNPPSVYDWAGALSGAGVGAATGAGVNASPLLGALIGGGAALSKREPPQQSAADWIPVAVGAIVLFGVVIGAAVVISRG